MFDVEIITPERVVYRGKASSLIAPGADGLFGILDHHAPLLNALQVGILTLRGEGGAPQFYALGGGFLEVSANQVVVLADSAEDKSKISVERAKLACERAEKRLREKGSPQIDAVRAEAALSRALNRLRLASLT